MKLLRRISISIMIAVMIICTLSCNVNPPLSKDTFDLIVGEYVDIAQYVEGDFSLSVSDTSIVSVISDTVLHAQKPGSTTAVISRGRHSDVINVYVSYAPTNLTVSCSSPLYTDVKGSILEFTADLGSNADQTTEVIWKTNGRTAGVGKVFTLSLDEYAKYKVSAHAAGQECALTAVCVKAIDQAPTISWESPELSMLPYSEIKFTTIYDYESEPEIFWYVNGNIEQNSQTEFVFAPNQVGEYTVWAMVNGVKTNEITFVAEGLVQPQNVRIDYDSDFPNLYLRWDGLNGVNYQVYVGDVVYYSDSQRFQGNSFDLTGLVSQGDTVSISGESGEDYAAEAVTVTVPEIKQTVRDYLTKKYFDGNYYMTSDQEVYDVIAYAIMFRPNATAISGGEKVAFSVYMGYDSQNTAALLLSKGWAYLEQTGKYSLKASGKTRVGGIVNFEITFLTDDEPSNFDVSYKTAFESLTTPFFRGGATAFAIDEAKNGGTVITSDQLYYMVQKGYKPQPQPDSSAERIYSKARTVLGQIISDDMTDEMKVQSIYEWIMWQTTYDYEALTVLDLTEAVKQPAYYLEGVFDNGFAVCDGISKSMSLLCNMVGVPCIRVIGTADNGSPSRHAWNKVRIDNEWYIVDATWSDIRINMEDTVYEGALHAYYLKADCEMPTHKPSYPELYPTADSFYGGDMPSEFVADASMDELAAAVKHGIERATYEVAIGEAITQRDFYCIEICLSIKARAYFRSNTMLVSIVISETVDGSVPWVITGDYLLVMLYN